LATQTDRHQLDGFDPRIFEDSNFATVPGECMLVLHRPQEQVLARCAVMPFVVTEGETGKRFFQGVTLIAPPAAAWGIEQPEALAMFEAGIEEVWGCPLTDEDKGPLSRQVHLKHCADFDIESLLQVIEQCGDRQFVMVPWITHYRDATLARADQGPSTLVCEEDLWVPHVIATIRRALILRNARSFMS
jgi:hypothetical protein